ncbi:MAG: hypothetical protein ABW076_12135 [Candidatus Thiodiazotropha sp.]
MNLRNRAWRYATVAVVILILVNPETIELAVFIDAIGLELFLILIEVQVVTMLGAFLSNRFKPAVYGVVHFIRGTILPGSLKKIREGAECLIVSGSTEAALMHLLVVSAVFGGCSGIWQ